MIDQLRVSLLCCPRSEPFGGVEFQLFMGISAPHYADRFTPTRANSQ